jgi:flagellin
MALAIATNTAALNAAASASSVNRDMETSMARLSTGKRINSASDDAAGVAISSRLSAEIRGTDQAIRNSLDGQALIDTAEGAHQEIETSYSGCVKCLSKRRTTPTMIKTEQTCRLKWMQ